jgi:hypothetical protein
MFIISGELRPKDHFSVIQDKDHSARFSARHKLTDVLVNRGGDLGIPLV